jgi:hypothetical protein
MNFKIIIVILLAFSCDSKTTPEECQDLLFKSFRGFPRAAHKFKKHCLKEELKYTYKTCKKALNQLVLGSSEEQLKGAFGPDIMNCFSKNDLDKFLKK